MLAEASMANNSTSKHSVFRADFDVAWPVWAGGYPSQKKALEIFAQNEADLRFAIEQRMKQLLGVEFELALFRHQGSGHRPIASLWPKSHPPNSLSLLVEVRAPDAALRLGENLDIE